MTELRKKVKQGKVIKKKPQVVSSPISKKKPQVVSSKPSKKKPQVVSSKTSKKKHQVVSTTHSKKIKTFEDYFEECIKNKRIPKDTPSYLRKALERAIKEHDQGIEIEKSALDEFAKKYIIEGESGITPFQFFESKISILKNFLRNHRNTKVRFVLVCIMEKMEKMEKK